MSPAKLAYSSNLQLFQGDYDLSSLIVLFSFIPCLFSLTSLTDVTSPAPQVSHP